jgi:hypothetical protein
VRPLCSQGSTLGHESAESVLHNKMLLLANYLQSPVSQLATSPNISWELVIRDCGDGELSPSLSLGCIPRNHREETPTSRDGQLDPEGDSSSGGVRVRASDAQRNPVRRKNQRGEGCTAHQTGKNPGSNSDLPGGRRGA